MTWKEYEDSQWEQWRETRDERESGQTRVEWELAHPVQTARDRYGWRGLVGTSYLGPQPPKEPAP